MKKYNKYYVEGKHTHIIFGNKGEHYAEDLNDLLQSLNIGIFDVEDDYIENKEEELQQYGSVEVRDFKITVMDND